MPIGSNQKSSIDFLLSGPPAEETASIEHKTVGKTTSNFKRRKISRPKSPNFSLKILQQPSHAKVSPRPPSRVFPPFSEHRPIHPPPVLQLRVDDFKFKNDPNFLDEDYLNQLYNENDPRSLERIEELKIIRDMRLFKLPSWSHYSTFFVTARLQTVKGTNEKMLFNNKSEKSIDDLLIGTKVCSGMPISLRTSSPSNSYLKKSLPGEKPKASNYAITFVFSDLSVRKIGTFSLKFDLFEVFQGKIFWRNEILSDEFTVYTPKKFPGSFPSTALTSFLYKHGARIRQRKRSAPSVRKYDEIEDQNDEYHNDQAFSQGHNHTQIQQQSSSSALAKSATSSANLPPTKLPKIQENPYTSFNHSTIYASSSTQPPSSVSRLDQPFTKLPSVEHFHETAFNFSHPINYRLITQQQQQQQQLPPQPIHNFPLVFNSTPKQQQQQQGTLATALIPLSTGHHHPPPPPPGAYIQHIPVTPGTYYHPPYPLAVQQLPPGVAPPPHIAQQQQQEQQQQQQPQDQRSPNGFYKYGE